MGPLAGFGALIGGATSISFGVIAVKEGYSSGSDPDAVMAARMLVAAPFVAASLPFLLRGGRGVRWPAAIIAVAAGSLLWLSTRAELEGLARLPAGMVALLLATAPLWVAAIDWIRTGRPPERFEAVAMLILVAGVAVIAAPLGQAVNLVGVVCGLASAVGFAVFLLVLDRNRGVTPVQAFPLGILGAAVTVALTDPGAATAIGDGLSVPLALALGASIAGWALLVGLGLEATSPLIATMVVAVEPVLVAILAFLIIGEQLTARQLAGGVLVVGALVAVAMHLRPSASLEARESA